MKEITVGKYPRFRIIETEPGDFPEEPKEEQPIIVRSGNIIFVSEFMGRNEEAKDSVQFQETMPEGPLNILSLSLKRMFFDIFKSKP